MPAPASRPACVLFQSRAQARLRAHLQHLALHDAAPAWRGCARAFAPDRRFARRPLTQERRRVATRPFRPRNFLPLAQTPASSHGRAASSACAPDRPAAALRFCRPAPAHPRASAPRLSCRRSRRRTLRLVRMVPITLPTRVFGLKTTCPAPLRAHFCPGGAVCALPHCRNSARRASFSKNATTRLGNAPAPPAPASIPRA